MNKKISRIDVIGLNGNEGLHYPTKEPNGGGLPSDYQKYYVYTHTDPQTKELLYIGMGTKDRAWHYRVSMSRHRSHMEHLNKLTEAGYLPSDWVNIEHRNLTKGEAEITEKRLIQEYKPKFNYQYIGGNPRINQDLKTKAQELKDKGVLGRKAAEELRVSIMTAWRYQYVY